MVRASSSEDVFRAIGCPTRRTILKLLSDRRRAVGELVEELQLRQPSVSEQLRVLRDTGLVEVEQAGRTRFYRLNPQGFQPLIDWVSEFTEFWDSKLNALESYLEKQQREKST